jgi:hypothetical protein
VVASSICRSRSQTTLPRRFTFADPEKIRELAKRGEAMWTSKARQMLEYAIETTEVVST